MNDRIAKLVKSVQLKLSEDIKGLKNLEKKEKEVIKKLMNMTKGGSYHLNHEGKWFTHEDLRDLAQDARSRYGLDFFKDLDPQKICYLALIAVIPNLDDFAKPKDRKDPLEIPIQERHKWERFFDIEWLLSRENNIEVLPTN